MSNKLILKKPAAQCEREMSVWISKKAHALICDISKRAHLPKHVVCNRMIEFAYDHCEIMEEYRDDSEN